MAGKKIDRANAQTALEVVRESPTIALITAAPVLVVFGVLWWLLGFWTVLVLAAVLGLIAFVVKKVI
ncbi:hypothetical protein [Rhodococcus spongiicola]|uniref:Uncharacterized protein n=1 Tax=Rhodococcus spongiicola TaxID=2487352 RepID=A0A438AS22_9NOCA|nr:hypothetical protein [Rhodococcus spongiicola]RVW01518.1 hypothetical protein EF834_13850 [Rhodococcus spongiicola]